MVINRLIQGPNHDSNPRNTMFKYNILHKITTDEKKIQ